MHETAVKIKVVNTRVGIQNCFTRMPFRFDVITMRASPLAVLEVEIEGAYGRRAKGYAADFLTYKWLDKRPEKSGGDMREDLARLEAISEVMFAVDDDFAISLDGNEQYRDLSGFLDLIEAIKASLPLRRFYESILFIEQPLERSVAMDETVKPALAALAKDKPVIIGEADGWVTAFSEAIELGYRGVSHKNCKGVYKSIMNTGLSESRPMISN